MFVAALFIFFPFREGNERTQRVFLSQLALNAGYEIDFSTIDTDELMVATIHSANGIDTYLKNAFKKITKPIKSVSDTSTL